jgi:hypothetical protein
MDAMGDIGESLDYLPKFGEHVRSFRQITRRALKRQHPPRRRAESMDAGECVQYVRTCVFIQGPAFVCMHAPG